MNSADCIIFCTVLLTQWLPQHETLTDPARLPSALRHQGGAAGSFKGRKNARGGEREDPAALGGQDTRSLWVILTLPSLPAPAALPLPSSWQDLILRPSCISSPSTARRCPAPWAGFSPQSRGSCLLCPASHGRGRRVSPTWHPHLPAAALGSVA